MKKNSLASRLVTTITVVAITSVAFAASPASAQVNVTPAADGPGAAQIQRVLNWLAQYALWSGLAAVIFGAGWMGWDPVGFCIHADGAHKFGERGGSTCR